MNIRRILDALLVGLLIFMAYEFYRKATISADDFMIINKVFVPDHSFYEDPVIVYDRTIFQLFHANWFVRIKQVSTNATKCKGSGTSEYAPGDKVTNMTLSHYAGVVCDLERGEQYILYTRWVQGEVTIRNTSNVFTVN